MGWDEAFDEAVLRRDIHYELGARAAAPVPVMGDRDRRSWCFGDQLRKRDEVIAAA